MSGRQNQTTASQPTRWLALARLSDKWRDDPLERQAADLLDVVERTGGQLIQPVLVERVSGSQYRPDSVKRPGWDRIMEAVAAGEVDGVAVYNIDRLTREPFAAEQLIRAAEGGLRVADPATTVDLSTGDGRQFFRGKVAAAAAESDAISRRVRRANEAKREAGKPFWSFRPFGFQLDGSEHATEGPIVRDLYRRFVDGESLGALSAWLEADGWTQPARTDKESGDVIAKPWTPAAVRKLLAADRNCGIQRSGTQRGRTDYGTRKADGIAPIVDRDTFQAASRLLDTNAARYAAAVPTNNQRRHLLSGLLVCGVCGRKLSAIPDSRGSVKYICRKDRSSGRLGCGLTVSAPRVDELVVAKVLECLADEGYREAIATTADDSADRVQLNAAIQAAEDRIQELLAMTRGDDAVLTLQQAQPEIRIAQSAADAAQQQLDRMDAAVPLSFLPDTRDPELLAEGWDDMTLPQQQATIVDVLEPVVIAKATTRGRGFDPARVVRVPRYPMKAAA